MFKWFSALLSCLSIASASSVNVSPVIVHMNNEKSTSFKVFNTDSAKVRFTLEVKEWNGKEYIPSRDMMFSPSQFDIPASGTQMVRVGVRDPQGKYDKAYRIYLTEQPEENAVVANMAVQPLLKVSLPLMVSYNTPHTDWAQTEQKGSTLLLKSPKQAYAIFQNIVLKNSSEQVYLDTKYVFSGQETVLDIPLKGKVDVQFIPVSGEPWTETLNF